MIIKYSWLQYKRIVVTNKLLFGHIIIFIPGIGFFIYYMKGGLVSTSNPWISNILFYIFLFQTLLIIGKRLKNEYFFSTRSYTIFPQKRIRIIFYTLVFGIIDLNVFLYFIVSLGMILFVANWSCQLNVTFLLIFALCEITYLIYMMVTIEFMTEKYGNSKNLFLVTFLLFMLIGQFTLLAKEFYLFDFYPISGWIGSTVLAVLRGDPVQVLFYFGVVIVTAIIGLLLLNKTSFPRKNNVF